MIQKFTIGQFVNIIGSSESFIVIDYMEDSGSPKYDLLDPITGNDFILPEHMLQAWVNADSLDTTIKQLAAL